RRLEEYFDRLLEGRRFEDLERELVVVTTDVDTGERVLLREGPLAPALRASASLPGVFAPVALGGRRLIDGGIGSPVPLETVVELGVDVALGIGAGMQARDSRSIRLAKRALGAGPVRKLHSRALTRRPRTAVGRLGHALALAAGTWLRDESEERADGVSVAGTGRFEVHTRPPISWLNFHRAREAIAAGDAALSSVVPRLRHAVAAVGQGRAAALATSLPPPSRPSCPLASQDPLAQQAGRQLHERGRGTVRDVEDRVHLHQVEAHHAAALG